MFDHAACLAIRTAASPRVDTAALIALKTCLADASGAGLCDGPLSNASASGAGRSSCNQNQGAARATQVLPSTQPPTSRQAVRSFRSARREAPDPGVRVATATGEDPRDGDRPDGTPTRRFPTGFATERRRRKPDLNHRSPRDASFRDRICRLHSRQAKSRRERERQHEDTGRLRGTNGSNPASSTGESRANLTSDLPFPGIC
jgi:hypothetical protein